MHLSSHHFQTLKAALTLAFLSTPSHLRDVNVIPESRTTGLRSNNTIVEQDITAQFPDKLQGAKLVTKYPAPGAKFLFIHVKTIHEDAFTVAETGNSLAISDYAAIVQSDLPLIYDSIAKAGIKIGALYPEGCDLVVQQEFARLIESYRQILQQQKQVEKLKIGANSS